jgi:hypothetical protein
VSTVFCPTCAVRRVRHRAAGYRPPSHGADLSDLSDLSGTAQRDIALRRTESTCQISSPAATEHRPPIAANSLDREDHRQPWRVDLCVNRVLSDVCCPTCPAPRSGISPSVARSRPVRLVRLVRHRAAGYRPPSHGADLSGCCSYRSKVIIGLPSTIKSAMAKLPSL